MEQQDGRQGERRESKVEAATGVPKISPTDDQQHDDVTDSDATDTMQAREVGTERLTAAEAMIEEDLDRARLHRS